MRTIELTDGRVAKVDDEDFAHLSQFAWFPRIKGRRVYAARRLAGPHHQSAHVFMHREIMWSIEKSVDIDHANGDGLDNQRSNLRTVSRSVNIHRQRRIRSACSSRFKGVCFDKSKGKWVAYITKDYRRKHIGRYRTEEEAATAYNEKALELFGDHALLNVG